jgi:hypothetical protein
MLHVYSVLVYFFVIIQQEISYTTIRTKIRTILQQIFVYFNELNLLIFFIVISYKFIHKFSILGDSVHATDLSFFLDQEGVAVRTGTYDFCIVSAIRI